MENVISTHITNKEPNNAPYFNFLSKSSSFSNPLSEAFPVKNYEWYAKAIKIVGVEIKDYTTL